MDSRHRRKIKRRQLIHEAAVLLAREAGTEAVTIEAICEAAGISQRTFFNYFPFKEAVFVFPPPPLPEEARVRFLAGKGELLSDLTELMVAQAEVMMANDWQRPIMHEIAETHPRLMPLQVAEFRKFEIELQHLIAKRLGVDADNISAIALAGAISGATHAANTRGRTDGSPNLPQIVRETFKAMLKVMRT